MAGGRTRVAHREYLGDITGSVNFAIAKTVAINPGVPASFPWLAYIARQYESYYVRSMCFEYETQESTATAGTVMLAVDYDATDLRQPRRCSCFPIRERFALLAGPR